MFKATLAVLLMMGSPLLAVDPYKLSQDGDYEASDLLLKKMTPADSEAGKYAFYRGVNAFALNNKDEAKKWLNFVCDTFETVPTRYKNTASIMLYDIEHWKNGDLADIGRDMKMSGDRLQVAKGGEKTQAIQKEIVSKLDKLIKETEDKANGKGDGKDGQQQAKGQAQGQGKPADDSNIMGGSGKGTVDEKKLKNYAENWGKLPPAERAKAMQEITRDLPPKYKPMIEEYFKALARTPSSTDK